MSKSNSFENALMLLLFNNTNIANIGDATGLRGSSVAGDLYLSLHTADPGEGGDQTTSECNYTSYARKAIVRDGTNLPITGNSVSPGADQDFPNPSDATNLPQTATHWGVGSSSSGAGLLMYSGTITPNIVISNTGSTPRLKATSAVTED